MYSGRAVKIGKTVLFSLKVILKHIDKSRTLKKKNTFAIFNAGRLHYLVIHYFFQARPVVQRVHQGNNVTEELLPLIVSLDTTLQAVLIHVPRV